MKELLIILFSAILVDNFVLSRFLGICPFLGVSKNVKTAMGMSTAVIVVMVIASALTWPVQFFILYPLNLGYLQTGIFIVIIASLVQIIETFLRKSVPSLYRALGIYLPLTLRPISDRSRCDHSQRRQPVTPLSNQSPMLPVLVWASCSLCSCSQVFGPKLTALMCPNS